jgi:hypothetical protein
MSDLNQNKVALLVLSCDKYADMWEPFFNFLRLNWPDCPYKIYLSTNFKLPIIKDVHILNSNFIADWSTELKSTLNKIPEDNIILFLEDYFIRKVVKSPDLSYFVNNFIAQNAAYMRLGCFGSKYNEIWPYKISPFSKKIGVIDKNAKYLVCLQVALWRKSFLEELLVEGESPWLFEIEGSKRASEKHEDFLCVKEDRLKFDVHGPIVYLCGAITQGVLMQEAIRMARKNNFFIDLTKRPVETKLQEVTRRIRIALPMFVRHCLDFIKSKVYGRNKCS